VFPFFAEREHSSFGGATMENKQKPVLSRTEEVVIGRNRYIVTTHFKENGRETAEDKLFRVVTSRISHQLKTPKKAVV
jgi:hypothetical protein